MALGDLLYQIELNTLILVTFFLIVFGMLMWILRRTGLGKNNAIATVISLCIAFMAMYGLNTLDFDLTGRFYDLGISENILYIATPILTLFFLFFLSRKKDSATGKRKFSFGRFLIILGGLLLVLGFMPFIYAKALLIGVGAGLVALGGIILKKKNGLNSSSYSKKRRKSDYKNYYKNLKKKQKAQQRLNRKEQKRQQKLAEKQSRRERKRQEKALQKQTRKEQKLREKQERIQAEKELKQKYRKDFTDPNSKLSRKERMKQKEENRALENIQNANRRKRIKIELKKLTNMYYQKRNEMKKVNRQYRVAEKEFQHWGAVKQNLQTKMANERNPEEQLRINTKIIKADKEAVRIYSKMEELYAISSKMSSELNAIQKEIDKQTANLNGI